MEPTPSTSRPFKEVMSPRKKRKMSHFSENEKVMIINVFKTHCRQSVGRHEREVTKFLEGLSTGAKNPTSKGNRLILLHIGSDRGFVSYSWNVKSYVIDEMAKAAGVEVLRLPPYHCELNPIELVWADVKGYVARNNTTFKMVDVKKLLQEGLNRRIWRTG
ncbi:unnamed protein product [Pieris brassicae]|uniref:Tc1-like transposase DDE domain-containing protein n=1 Tax=Pieris brassicae TaxID=7116 RepID=A0A9P0TT86_PIEBR|nr:unnamed protein product [Pieris brassicae]